MSLEQFEKLCHQSRAIAIPVNLFRLNFCELFDYASNALVSLFIHEDLSGIGGGHIRGFLQSSARIHQ